MNKEIDKLINLKDRIVLIIGGGRGIGKAIASFCVQAGAHVIITARSESELKITFDEFNKCYPNSTDIETIDSTNVEKMTELFAKLQATFGCLDVLVNVAGTSAQVPAEAYSQQLFSTIYNLNCNACFSACALAYPLLKKSKYGGRVITIASHLGIVALPLRTIYCSSKAAVIHYSRTLASEWAKDNITVNCIAPGYTATELANKVLSKPEFRQEVLSKTPLGFIGEPNDIAAAALFLASSASRYMTGQTLVIDGGWSCV